jgi:hypothetical protein
MTKLRAHLTYANVLATLTLFAVLAGGTAIAANQLAKNSVGKKQLKANSVSAKKLKKNSVTAAKIKKGAVSEAQVKPSSLTGADLSTALPYGRIGFSARGTSSVTLPATEEPISYPLDQPTFSQEAGAAATVLGGVDVSIPAGCVNPAAGAIILIDSPNPLDFPTSYLEYGSAVGYLPEGIASGTYRISLSPGDFGRGAMPAPAAAQTHSIVLLIGGGCESGGSLTVTSGAVDAIVNR